MNSLITIVCCKNCVFINGPNCVGYSYTLEIGVFVTPQNPGVR